MADLFGAPQGILAADQNNLNNVLGGLKAQEMLGSIAQQPYDLQIKQAQARDYNAQALGREQAAAAQERMLQIQQRVASNRTANQQSLMATGLALTADQLDPVTGTVKTQSQADAIQQYAQEMLDAGATEIDVLPLRKDIAKIRQEESATLHTSAQATEQNALAKKERRKELGAAAAALVGLDDRTLNQVLLSGKVDPELAALVAKDPASARKTLSFISNAAIEADKKEELKFTEQRTKAAQASASAAQAVANARIPVLHARGAQIKQETEANAKAGGKYDPAVLEGKKNQATIDAQLKQARLNALYPQLPATDEMIVPNPKTGQYPPYQHNGMIYKVMGKNKKGQTIFADPVPLAKGLPVQPPAGSSALDEELLSHED